MSLILRDAVQDDIPQIKRYIEELAAFEKLSHICQADAALLQQHLFSATPKAHVIMAEWNGEPAGFALFFYNFSTFLARPGLYVEDVFVREPLRSNGIGKAIFQHLAQRALAEGCGRMEWWVLDWNTDAIRFYQRLGATAMDEWTVQRVEGDALHALAAL